MLASGVNIVLEGLGDADAIVVPSSTALHYTPVCFASHIHVDTMLDRTKDDCNGPSQWYQVSFYSLLTARIE